MKIINRYNSKNNIAVTAEIIYDIDRLKKELFPLPNHTETEQFKRIKNKNRRAEWLSTRYLLKEILGKYPGIEYEYTGRPILKHKLNLSVTHSKGVVGIVLSEHDSPGADIEIVNERIQRIAEKFTKPELIIKNRPDNTNRHLYAIWCGKETLFKMYAKGNLNFKEHLFIDTRQLTEQGVMIARINTDDFTKNYKINYHFFKHNNTNYIFTYCFNLK
ncbi:MAG: 4'-phosphopantetheinyl transferase superfamily protein [Bacteroidota bacterium]|nr:4'-phosphopantetheinyl transferase superfamily protein [Bacteroidota bacterium]